MDKIVYQEPIIFKNPNRPVRVSRGHIDKPQQLCTMHVHSEFEFLHLVSGGLVCHAGDKKIRLSQGDVLFLNSRVPHYTESTTPHTTYSFAQFRNPSPLKGSVSYLARYITHQENPFCIFPDGTDENRELTGYLGELFREKKNSDISSDYRSIAHIYLITALLHQKNLLPVPETLTDTNLLKKLMPALEYISENYQENIRLEALSHITSLNESYLCRLFKKATGGTVVDYVNFVRVCKAEKLLRSSMSISEVAYDTGFSSLSYFNLIFKRYNQCLPSQYRKMQSSDGDLMLRD